MIHSLILQSGTPPRRLLLFLWAAALVLSLAGLDNLPLRDWDEGIVARVALEIADRGLPHGLLPTIWGNDYLNKPPGLHWLIAAVISCWRHLSGAPVSALPPEWVVRLAPALLSTLVVPLGGLVQWQLRPGQRTAALATAAILLTLLPVMRQGRLAMLDGAQLSAMALLWWALLRSRRGQRVWANGAVAGLGGSALLLLKAPILLPALLAGFLGLAFDPTPGPKRWRWLLAGLVVGLLPGLAWHAYHGLMRGQGALWLWGGDGVGRVLLEAGEGSSLGWRVPLLKVLEGGWPWLPLWPIAVGMAWRQRQCPWGRWCLVLQAVMATSILPLRTQLPWYSHPLWLPFALLCAAPLADLLRPGGRGGVLRRLPWFWMVLGGVLLAAGAVANLPDQAALAPYRWLPLPAGAGLLGGGWLLLKPAESPRRKGLLLLIGGWWLSLLLLGTSPLWNWELNERWSVLPAATLAAGGGAPVYMDGDAAERPSLRWYAQREVRRLPDHQGGRIPSPFNLIRQAGDPPAQTLLRKGSFCSLKLLGDDNWQRWLCYDPATGESRPP
ncbi:glycosyltransferase family 39 protein [Cyanobium sp. Morenito 9A2]|uniref:ArnT family glycosyltransferase n=1 Tax=Cyanobium sp. Morenito 9A2 TaxID=2823718 RepID=UPI0020CDEEAD|nr:phospholipid carrier-dependent glycosyltransferase [Cyanobium sp. Morenito 9A2]MCP9851096.1 phospholipid carrier-dependent glycosyltransferase [Cyanobium sp. Morenito 9A2]